jgi:hypothetical protein
VGGLQFFLTLTEIFPVRVNLFHIAPNLASILEDFLFARAATNIPAQLRAILVQLLIGPVQVFAILDDGFARHVKILYIISNFLPA